MKKSFISFTSVCFFFHQVAQNNRSVLKVTKKRLRKMCSILLGIKKVDKLNNQKNPFKIRVYFFFYQAWWNVCEIRHVVTVNWWWHNGTFVLWRNNWTTEKQPNKHSLFPVLSHRRSDPAVFFNPLFSVLQSTEVTSPQKWAGLIYAAVREGAAGLAGYRRAASYANIKALLLSAFTVP